MWSSNDHTGNYPFLDNIQSSYHCYYRGNSGNCPREWDTYFCLSRMNDEYDYSAVTDGYVSKYGLQDRVWYLGAVGVGAVGSALAEAAGRGRAFFACQTAPGVDDLEVVNAKLINSCSSQNNYGYGKTLSPAAYDINGDQFDIRLFVDSDEWSSEDYISLLLTGDYCNEKPLII
jgi:hypothetical protein